MPDLTISRTLRISERARWPLIEAAEQTFARSRWVILARGLSMNTGPHGEPIEYTEDFLREAASALDGDVGCIIGPEGTLGHMTPEMEDSIMSGNAPYPRGGVLVNCEYVPERERIEGEFIPEDHVREWLLARYREGGIAAFSDIGFSVHLDVDLADSPLAA